MIGWIALVACSPEDIPEQGPAEQGVPLSLIERAVRISTALRGERPGFEELDALSIRGEDALEDLVDTWLEEPAFGETVRDLWNEALQVRADIEPLDATGSLAGYTLEEIHVAIQESPLHTIERIVLEDRPYTEIVTGDFVDAEEITARAWTGMEPFDPAGPERQALRWIDGRPVAGILSDSSLWLRWRSAGANAQRGRANLVARALLCEDFLARDASIDTSAVADPSAGTSIDSPSCAICHQALDPLASFFPFLEYPAVVFLVFPVDMYEEDWVETEGWSQTTGRPPDYYGLGGTTLGDLASLVASDPRFSRCVAQRHRSFLYQQPLSAIPTRDLDRYQSVLQQTGSMRELFRAIVLDERFSSVAAQGSLMRLRAEALPRMIEDLTGFRWVVDGEEQCCGTPNAPLGDVDLGDDALRGWVLLWGGIDGPYISQPTHESSTTSTLVLEEYAAFAAAHVVSTDLSEPDPQARRLLRWVEPETTDEAAVRAQLVRLHQRVLGEDLAEDDPLLDASYDLFVQALAYGGQPARAWAVVLYAMLSDERLEYY